MESTYITHYGRRNASYQKNRNRVIRFPENRRGSSGRLKKKHFQLCTQQSNNYIEAYNCFWSVFFKFFPPPPLFSRRRRYYDIHDYYWHKRFILTWSLHNYTVSLSKLCRKWRKDCLRKRREGRGVEVENCLRLCKHETSWWEKLL